MNRISLFLPAALAALAAAAPATAQQAAPPRWRPTLETVTVSAMAASKNLRAVLTGTNLPQAFAISASIPVPYGDLNLTRDADASEFTRRIGVAAQLVCYEIDLKYPPSQYPNLGDEDCVGGARKDGLAQANAAIAAARQ
jgi:UrcA family protein